MTRSRSFVGALLGVLAFSAACEQAPQPLAPDAPQATQSQLPGGENPNQHALGRAIPAFGGLFLDGGVPTVYLTDPSARGAVEHALSGFMAARGIAPSAMQVLQARFSYSTLEGFFDRVRPQLFAGPGTVFADLDEAHNRILIGVQDAAAADRVHAWVSTLGLPDGAVAIERAEPIHALATMTLQSKWDVIPAGVQIHFGNYLCSIGIIAQVGGMDNFVTASHCTNKQGGVEGTQYYQPLSSTDPTVIGTEVEDPVYISSKDDPSFCPYGGKVCRLSDAALIRSTGARPYAQGEIAEVDPGGSLTWNGSYFNVTGKASGNGIVGDSRGKVGRTTGYTTGVVTASCVDTGVQGSRVVQLCQDFVENNGKTVVGAGDSGSGVFKGTSNVTYWGSLWGGNSSGTEFVYSPTSNVEAELGTLDVTGSGSSGGGGGGGGGGTTTLAASFTYSCHFGDCAFDATSSTGATSWSWAFGDTQTGSGEQVSHTYTTAKSYDVTLTVGDGTTNTAQATQTLTCMSRGPNVQCK